MTNEGLGMTAPNPFFMSLLGGADAHLEVVRHGANQGDWDRDVNGVLVVVHIHHQHSASLKNTDVVVVIVNLDERPVRYSRELARRDAGDREPFRNLSPTAPQLLFQFL